MEKNISSDVTRIGRLKIIQPSSGFRFTTDSLLLQSILPGDRESYFEIGTGTGVCSLLQASGCPRSEVTAIEIQKTYYDMAEQNRSSNALENLELIHGDVRDYARNCGRTFSVVFSNPPYRKWGTGRLSPDEGRNISIYDRFLRPVELFSAAATLTKRKGGEFYVLSLEDNRDDFIHAAEENGFFITKVYKFENRGNHRLCAMAFSLEMSETTEKTICSDTWMKTVDDMFREV